MHERDLESFFKVLSNKNRLALLRLLSEPRGYADLHLAPTRSDGVGSARRAISRAALRNHLQPMIDLGLVVEIPPAKPGGPMHFVTNHGMLFSVLEQARRLGEVMPSSDVGGVTRVADRPVTPARLAGPHLYLARGVGEGRTFTFPNDGMLGRDEGAAVRLDYDPHISHRHARLLQSGKRCLVQALPTGRNGTFVNDERLQDGAVAQLRPGDAVAVGLSLLVFRGP